MANDSSTGGLLLPSADSPVPLEGQALLRFLQQWVVGLSGLPGALVRPYWQGQVPDLPKPSTQSGGSAWCALGVKTRPAQAYPAIRHDGSGANGTGESRLTRHEEIELLCSFYDKGADGQADQYMSLCRDGSAIAQNHEYLFNAGFGWIKCDAPITAPSLLKQVWLYRVDLTMHIRRAISRAYPIRNLLEAQGTFFTTPGHIDGTTRDAAEDWVAKLSDT